MYNILTNDTLNKTHAVPPCCLVQNAFDDEEIKEILKFVENTPLHDGRASESTDIRTSSVSFHGPNDSQDSNWIFNKLNIIIHEINDRFFNFDLDGYNFFQYTEYYGSKNGKYDFHMDLVLGDKTNINIGMLETRKLSLSLLLNDPEKDFSGGNFEINSSLEEKKMHINMKRGDIIFFPSYMLHRVSTLTKGTRKSLVVWVTGPKFR
jgi:PKHD-type hydroxylase